MGLTQRSVKPEKPCHSLQSQIFPPTETAPAGQGTVGGVSSALPEQKASGQKEQEEEQSSTTGGSSEETEDHEKWHKLSAYHNWDQRGCVRFKLWSFRHRESEGPCSSAGVQGLAPWPQRSAPPPLARRGRESFRERRGTHRNAWCPSSL